MIRENQRFQIRRTLDLVVRADGEGLACPVETPLGSIRIGLIDGVAHRFETDSLGIQRSWIEFHPYGGFLVALDRDKSDTGNLAQFLGQNRVGEVIHPYQRQRFRSDRKCQDWGVGGIDLIIDRWIRHVGRQDASRCIDCRLHILGCLIDVLAENKLERDDGGSLGTDRVHRGEAADLTELLLQWCRHEGSHHFGIRSRIPGGDLDCRKVNGGKRRDR